MFLAMVPWVFNPMFLFFSFLADLLVLPVSIKTTWIDIEYNAFFFADMIIDFFLVPYYGVAFIIIIFDAMRNRDMYDEEELNPTKN